MKNHFRGWTSVFGFTFKQSVSVIGFKLGTAIVSILIIAALIIVNLIVANKSEDKSIEPSPIETVYIQDNTGLAPTSFSELINAAAPEAFGHIQFIDAEGDNRNEIIKSTANSSNSIAVFIESKDAGYELEAVIPAESSIKTKQANKLLKEMISAFETNKLISSGMSGQQLTVALSPVVTTLSDIGESTDEIVFAIKLIGPMVFGLILYIMLILYGQIISKSVSTEKTSKLMETLLTSIHPYALISGKILGIASSAILQFGIWVISLIGGLYGGSAIAQHFYPGYENSVITIINFFREKLGETALSLPAVILGLIILFVGFLFYCVIAGLAGCLVSKPEEVASTQAIFQLPIIVSWLICYLAPVYKKEGILAIARYVPFTSPFCVPVDLITGTVSIGEGLVSLVILAVFSLIVIMLSARIYKGLVLYTGQKISLKLIGKVIKANK